MTTTELMNSNFRIPAQTRRKMGKSRRLGHIGEGWPQRLLGESSRTQAEPKLPRCRYDMPRIAGSIGAHARVALRIQPEP